MLWFSKSMAAMLIKKKFQMNGQYIRPKESNGFKLKYLSLFQ
ncbi:hypothetical protein SAMN05444481_1248 [Flavobacterium frigidimaris]|nr:hypothetical protein SAMN05444481_1248 [Flavobacterium frigidimaris]